MLRRAHSIFVIFLATLHRTCGDNAIKYTNERRHDSGADGYQMCLESFDIHRDKIIKTQDSRDMGAKYLSVLDVDSRVDCLKYCCETEQCDVFIFEEKKPGSCYLFQCGPLHDFKCKFTRHTNYTSAVRTSYPTQNKQEEEEEIRISQQEHELKSLRKNTEIKSDYGFTETPVKSIVTQIPKLPTTPAPIKPACSRNQYECRSSGECIAIYNVCDGIPQCADGSDEASDLVCPTEKSTVSSIPQMPHPLPSDILRYQQLANRKPLNPFYPAPPEINLKNWETQNLPHQMSHQSVLYPGQSVDLPQVHKNYALPGYQWDYQPMYEQNKDLYVPVGAFQKQNVNPYEQQPHIFNHKGSSVIGNNEADRELYMDPKHSSYSSHFSLSNNKAAWQETPAHLAPSVAPNFQPPQVTSIDNIAKSTMTPACDTSGDQKKELKQKSEPAKKEEKTDTYSKHSSKATKHVTEKSHVSANEVVKHNDHAKESKDHESVVVIEEHARTHERVDLVAERLQIFKNDVLKPKGAVVSLSLGLVATAITVALIVCRLRVMKRRGRCGHGPYAHDADYLVNGMYL